MDCSPPTRFLQPWNFPGKNNEMGFAIFCSQTSGPPKNHPSLNSWYSLQLPTKFPTPTPVLIYPLNIFLSPILTLFWCGPKVTKQEDRSRWSEIVIGVFHFSTFYPNEVSGSGVGGRGTDRLDPGARRGTDSAVPRPWVQLSEWLGSHHSLCKCVGPAERGTRGDGVGSLKEKRKVPTSQVPTGQV